MQPRAGRQTPTRSVILPYTQTKGQEAVDLYAKTGRTAQEWQSLLLYDMLAYNEDGRIFVECIDCRPSRAGRSPHRERGLKSEMGRDSHRHHASLTKGRDY